MTRPFPQQFGKFVLTSLLAHGGMSQVLLAKFEGVYGFRRLVVVKRLTPHFSEDPAFVELFLREAALGARLQHPNIAQVFDSGRVDDQLYMALEYVDGVDLRVLQNRLRRDGARCPLGAVVHVVGEACRGIDYAHRARDENGEPLGVVHGDVSPSNVLLSRDGAVKVCDFGIATVIANAPSGPAVRGKYGYSSPEQAAGRPLDARSDVFSMGILLWELLTGQRLYRGETEISTLALARRADVPRLDAASFPDGPALQAIVDAALAADPASRTATALELRRTLSEWAKGAGVRASAQELADLLERACVSELRRRGQRRDGLPVDEDATPATPTGGEPEAPRTEVVASRPSRASLPVRTLETVEPPEHFPIVESRPPEERALIVSRPDDGPRGRSSEDDLLSELAGELPALDAATRWRTRERAEREHTSLVRALLTEGAVEESELCRALARISALPTVDLSTWTIPRVLADHLPRDLARAWEVVPFRVEPGRGRSTLCVAIVEPETRMLEPEIEQRSGMRPKFFLARPAAIAAAVRRLYDGVDTPIPVLHPPGIPER